MATSTLGSGTLVLAGTTSGTTTVTATAVAGTTTLTLPAATDTLVGKATTDTLTNKTLTGAAMNGTVGATTPSTGAFTTLTSTGAFTTTGGSNVQTSWTLAEAGTRSLVLKNPTSTLNASVGTGTNHDLVVEGNTVYVNTGSFGARSTVGTFSSTGLAVTGLVDISAATSGQIKFPATQNASTNANTLDDYEEGTWNPTDNSGAGLTFTSVFASYIKIGRAVTINVELTFPITANTTAVAISLPVSSDSSTRGGGAIFSNRTGGTNIYFPGGANFVLYDDTGAAITNATMSTKYIIFSLTYFTA